MVICSFLNVIYLEDCVEKLATLHFKTKILYSKHMLWLILMAEEVVLTVWAFCS